MKGTLFSADFVKDSEGNLRLMELNTDTAVIDRAIPFFELDDFFNVLSGSNITELHVVYKSDFHKNLVNLLETTISSSYDFITTFERYEETIDTIYPTTVNDADNRFILRMAYDASAIFDDTYARVDFNTLNLFVENGDTGSVVEFFHSSSNGTANTINYNLNDGVYPDFVAKPLIPVKKSLEFIKLSDASSSVSERIDTLLNDSEYNSDKVISKYFPSTGSKSSSIRSFQIIYGSGLDICYLADYEIESILSYPETVDFETTSSYFVYPQKHYYEFATNDTSEEKGLVPETNILLDELGSNEIKNMSVGDVVDSFYIYGYSSDETQTSNWFESGSVIPSGSFNTSSIVYDNTSVEGNTIVVHDIQVESNDSFYSAGGTLLLAYKSSEDSIKFRTVKSLEVGDYCYDRLGNQKQITKHDILFLDNSGITDFNFLDVEETDNYIISGSNIVVHNAPCFVAGTKIKTSEDSYIPIELVKKGNQVLTYNFSEQKIEKKQVLETTEREISEVVEYTLENGTTLIATLDHPLYEITKGWSSYNNELSNKMYKLEQEVQKLEIGDTLKLSNGETKVINMKVLNGNFKVYNLSHVDGNNNFFAEDVLVHNRVFGIFSCFDYDTLVEMWNGSKKPIGLIQLGDEVKSYKDGQYVKGIVTDCLIHPVNDFADTTEMGSMISDRFHPFYENGEWKPISELKGAVLNRRFISEFYNLEIDGDKDDSEHNYIVEGVIVSGLGDNERLNKKYKRQPIYERI